MELSCKKCGGASFVKNGFVRGLQRYRCRSCGFNFTATRNRGRSEATKALAVLLYSFGKASYRWLGKLLGVSGVGAYKWVRQAAEELPEPEIREEIREMELDELWHFLQAKKTSVGFGKPMTLAHGVVSPGWWVAVIMLPLNASGNASPVPDVSTTPMIGPSTTT
jgi:transposase-like protein